MLKVREGGRTVNVHPLLATGVNGDGDREILGLQVTSAEDGAAWLEFFRDLAARGLSGVALVKSDAHRACGTTATRWSDGSEAAFPKLSIGQCAISEVAATESAKLKSDSSCRSGARSGCVMGTHASMNQPPT